MVEGFTTTNRYFDNRYCPCGFSRHDDFATKETQLFERHGHAFSELNPGKRKLVTKKKKLFAAVYRGEREPMIKAERMWSRYMARIKRPKRFHTLFGGKPQVEDAEDYTDSGD